MKQCCESHKVDRRELLYVVRSEQNSRQSLADSNKDESQGQNLKTVNDMLKMPHSNAVNRLVILPNRCLMFNTEWTKKNFACLKINCRENLQYWNGSKFG